MRKEYEVEWAAAAEQDLADIVEYIALETHGQALQVLERIRQKASHLYALPERGRIVPELNDQGIQIYRELIESPWRIVYRISDPKVYVLAVFDSRRNVEDILLKRFSR
jgi:plasmid stabilization system protein ParE